MLIGVMLLTSLFGGGSGVIWVEEGFKLACTLLFEKCGPKLVLAVRKTKTKMDRASQLNFLMIVGSSQEIMPLRIAVVCAT